MEKIKRFLASDRKVKRLFMFANEKIRGILHHMYYSRRFREFGRGSTITCPDRMFGLRHVSIRGGVSILHHMRMEAITHYGDQELHPNLVIGEGTSIGQNFHVVSTDDLIIGKEVTISGNVFISTASHSYHEIGKHILRQKLYSDRTEIGDYSFIGFGASVQPGARLGRQCIVGTNAVVLKGEYPDGCVLAGVPARVVRQYNVVTKRWVKRVSEEH